MDYYPWEKLSSAVEILVGPEPIEERLRLASVSLSMLHHRPSILKAQARDALHREMMNDAQS